LEGFLAGDVVSPRFFRTPFYKALESMERMP